MQTRQRYFKPYTIPAYVVDFLLQCCTILCSTTVYSDSPQTLTGLLLLPAIATYLQPKAEDPVEVDENGKPIEPEDDVKEEDRDPLPVKPFITSYRGAMMIITCTSILAVDFPVFPRRFGKTEAFGTSLMDLGVGSFVFAAGIVAARQQLKEDMKQSKRSFTNRMKTALRHSFPLFVLGIIRLLSVKGLDYAEHVSEYGVHWNFFFTLALLGPIFALIQPILRFLPSYGGVAFAIAVCYEIALYTTDLKFYIILSDRIPGDLLSQNREGVFSFIGYFAIFLGGMGVGQGILPRDEEPPPTAVEQGKILRDSMDDDEEWLTSVLAPGAGTTNTEGEPAAPATQPSFRPEDAIQMVSALPRLAVVHLIKWAGLWFIFSTWALWVYGPRLVVSRRMANCAYVCWVCAFNSAQLLLFCGVEMLMFPTLYRSRNKGVEKQRIEDATSKVLKAFNRNGLALFLLANLLTGAVNLGSETWYVSDVQAMCVLVGYIGTICATGLVLDHYDISIKL